VNLDRFAVKNGAPGEKPLQNLTELNQSLSHAPRPDAEIESLRGVVRGVSASMRIKELFMNRGHLFHRTAQCSP
jgi:hypothetical protein